MFEVMAEIYYPDGGLSFDYWECEASTPESAEVQYRSSFAPQFFLDGCSFCIIRIAPVSSLAVVPSFDDAPLPF